MKTLLIGLSFLLAGCATTGQLARWEARAAIYDAKATENNRKFADWRIRMNDYESRRNDLFPPGTTEPVENVAEQFESRMQEFDALVSEGMAIGKEADILRAEYASLRRDMERIRTEEAHQSRVASDVAAGFNQSIQMWDVNRREQDFLNELRRPQMRFPLDCSTTIHFGNIANTRCR